MPCTNCNWCIHRVHEHFPIGCAENPRAGRETEEEPPPARVGAVAIVGGGPSDLDAALEFERLGYTTHLYEARSHVGGGHVTSAAPQFKQPLNWYRNHLRHRLLPCGVTVHLNLRARADDVLALEPALMVVATGSRVNPFPLDADEYAMPVLDAVQVLLGHASLPAGAPVVVYGGGETGRETAEFLAERNIDVTLVTRWTLMNWRVPPNRCTVVNCARLQAHPRIALVAHGRISRVEARAVVAEVAGEGVRVVPAAALVIAQGRSSADELAPALRHSC